MQNWLSLWNHFYRMRKVLAMLETHNTVAMSNIVPTFKEHGIDTRVMEECLGRSIREIPRVLNIAMMFKTKLDL